MMQESLNSEIFIKIIYEMIIECLKFVIFAVGIQEVGREEWGGAATAGN